MDIPYLMFIIDVWYSSNLLCKKIISIRSRIVEVANARRICILGIALELPLAPIRDPEELGLSSRAIQRPYLWRNDRPAIMPFMANLPSVYRFDPRTSESRVRSGVSLNCGVNWDVRVFTSSNFSICSFCYINRYFYFVIYFFFQTIKTH